MFPYFTRHNQLTIYIYIFFLLLIFPWHCQCKFGSLVRCIVFIKCAPQKQTWQKWQVVQAPLAAFFWDLQKFEIQINKKSWWNLLFISILFLNRENFLTIEEIKRSIFFFYYRIVLQILWITHYVTVFWRNSSLHMILRKLVVQENDACDNLWAFCRSSHTL